MIVRDLKSLKDTDRHIRSKTNAEWSSKRYLLQKDDFPFSVNYTHLTAGCRMEISYQNHQEACFCISGKGKVIEKDGRQHEIYPGVLYALQKDERHTLIAEDDLVLISVFSPALIGPEIHDKNGSY